MQTVSRRNILKFALAGAAATGIGSVTLIRRAEAGAVTPAATTSDARQEVYRGRRISIQSAPHGGAAMAMASMAEMPGMGPMPSVLIDGVPLHVMTNADGTYSTVVNHYQTFPDLSSAARAGVDALNGATLVSIHQNG
jgi:hypothetical protein